jgi:ubiquinone/menaquinone biosynthesis C-methylase UbiE
VLNEARYAHRLAERMGVADRFATVVAVAEHIPIRDEMFNVVYSGGCLHHMAIDYAAPEIYRVLAPGGRFAAVEPWRTRLHHVGTRLLGKREVGVACRPLDKRRLEPIRHAFGDLTLAHHGPVLRYVALGLQKLTGRTISTHTGLRLARIDDALPIPRSSGGSLAILATRR